MAIPIPNLDDRTFSDLVEELRALIPRYAPDWTDHNVSDPGIMLIELFAWLAEALIYRLNRIPDASEARFLELLGAVFQPARPATIRLRLTVRDIAVPLSIPKGTVILAQNPGSPDTTPFETLHDVVLQADGVRVVARQSAYVDGEEVGISSGKPLQAVPLARSFVFFDLDSPLPCVPEVAVDGVAWSFRESFLDSGQEDQHFTVDPRVNAICFGDGTKGKIPPAGAGIAVSYRYTLGKGGNILSGASFTFSGDLGSQVSISLEEDGGVVEGTDPSDIQEARVRVARELKRRWRAITDDDFRALLVSEPVEELEHRIARVECLPELELTSSGTVQHRPGYITVVIVPETRDEKPFPTPECIEDVKKILEERRLITSRLHVTGPGYTDVKIRARVVLQPRQPTVSTSERIVGNLEAFFHPLTGGPQGKGWPFGRDVYPSEVYQVIEATEGVDHVESIGLYTRDEGSDWTVPNGRVEVPPNNLVNLVIESGDIEV